VAVTKNGDVYVVRFQGTLSNRAISPITVASSTLVKVSENADGTLTATPDYNAAAAVTGPATPNDMLQIIFSMGAITRTVPYAVKSGDTNAAMAAGLLAAAQADTVLKGAGFTFSASSNVLTINSPVGWSFSENVQGTGTEKIALSTTTTNGTTDLI